MPDWFPSVAVGALTGGLAACIVNILYNARCKRREMEMRKAALRAELKICAFFVGHFLKDKIQAPQFRLPVAAYHAHFHALAADGAIAQEILPDAILLFTKIDDFNRGLDSAAEALAAGNAENLKLFL